MKEKLDTELELNEIKQTRTKRITIPFRDSAIDKITRTNQTFGTKNYLAYNFDVSKGSSLKGLMLKFYEQTEKKSFVLSFWFNKRNDYYIVGSYPNMRCKDVERKCLELAETHQDERGIWIKNPNQTRIDEQRLVEKPDTTKPKGYIINEVIEAYCGAELPGETTERGFSRDRKDGYRRAKSCRNWFRYMAGYNHRNTLVRFLDDDKGYGYTSGGAIRQISELKEGISQENAKKIIGDIKKLKLKIQIKIQGEELRVDEKKRDDLQDAIAAIKAIDIGLPVEFINFRD